MFSPLLLPETIIHHAPLLVIVACARIYSLQLTEFNPNTLRVLEIITVWFSNAATEVVHPR